MQALTFAEVAETLPESPERNEVIENLTKEEPSGEYSRRTIFLLLGIAMQLSAKKSEA